MFSAASLLASRLRRSRLNPWRHQKVHTRMTDAPVDRVPRRTKLIPSRKETITMDPFDQRLAQLDVDIEAVHRRAAAATAFRQGTEKVRGRSSVDGIEVTVDSAGTLIDLDLGQDLAWARKAILDAYQKARQEAGRAVVTLAQENLGEDDPSISRLQEVYGITDEPERPEDGGAPRVGVWRPGGGAL